MIDMATRRNKTQADQVDEFDSADEFADEPEVQAEAEEEARPNAEQLANMAIEKLDAAVSRDSSSASSFATAHVLAILAVAEAIRELTAVWPTE